MDRRFEYFSSAAAARFLTDGPPFFV